MLWHVLVGVPNAGQVSKKGGAKWLSELANSSELEGKERIYELSKGRTISGLRRIIFKTQYF